MKTLEEEKIALEGKLHKVEKSESKFHKDAERRLAEMRRTEEETLVRCSVTQDVVSEIGDVFCRRGKRHCRKKSSS